MKRLHYQDIWANSYFWRTAQQQEIDYLEEKDGELYAFEFKWSLSGRVAFPKTFTEKYKPIVQEVITPENFVSFLGV